MSIEARVRRATLDDAEAIAELAERLFVQTFEPDNDPANVAAYVRTAFGDAMQREELSDPTVTFLLMDVGARPAAFAQLKVGSAEPSVNGDAPIEIQRFYVDHDYHGRGVASHLMDACFEIARVHGAQTVWLGVWERNARAIRFYEKSGFVDVGAKTFMMGSDLQFDRVMMRSVGVSASSPGSSPDT